LRTCHLCFARAISSRAMPAHVEEWIGFDGGLLSESTCFWTDCPARRMLLDGLACRRMAALRPSAVRAATRAARCLRCAATSVSDVPTHNKVRRVGFEPTHPFGQGLLRAPRLPFRHRRTGDLRGLSLGPDWQVSIRGSRSAMRCRRRPPVLSVIQERSPCGAAWACLSERLRPDRGMGRRSRPGRRRGRGARAPRSSPVRSHASQTRRAVSGRGLSAR
jgi:hypothetical protein